METDIKSEQLHNHLLEMVKQFHIFCIDNNLNYYILGGTCLGAKRHKGFIPWDDDIDVGMLRKDYEKFYALRKKLPDNLELRFYKNTKGSPMHYIKLIDNTTTLIESRYPNYIEGLYIDVFPLDYASNGNTVKEEYRRWRKIWLLQGLIIYHCMSTSPKGLVKKMVFLFSKILKLSALHSRLELEMTKKEDGEYYANFLGAWQKKEIISKDIFGIPTLYHFEDTQLFGPEKIDAYLRQLYDDYTVLPPIEKRVFKHDFLYLNLDLPYKEYLSSSRQEQVKN